MACGVSAQEETAAQRTDECGGKFQREFSVASDAIDVDDSGEFCTGEFRCRVRAPAAIPATQPAKPKYVVFGDRDDYRWQLGVGLEYLHFQSQRVRREHGRVEYHADVLHE